MNNSEFDLFLLDLIKTFECLRTYSFRLRCGHHTYDLQRYYVSIIDGAIEKLGCCHRCKYDDEYRKNRNFFAYACIHDKLYW